MDKKTQQQMKIIQKNLRKLRLKNNLTFAELSKRSGVAIDTLKSLESRNGYNPTIQTLHQICMVYPVYLKDIV